MKTTTSNPLILFAGIVLASAALARNDGFGRYSGDRSASADASRGTAPASPPATRVFSAPAPSRQVQFSRPETTARSAPATPSPRFTSPAVQQPAPVARAQETPSFRGASPRVSVSAPQTPVFAAPRVSPSDTPRVSPAPSPRSFSDNSPVQVTRPANTVRPQAIERAPAPVVARERSTPAPEAASPRFSPASENARTFGTSRIGGPSPAAAPQPNPAPRSVQVPDDRGLSRTDAAARNDAVRRIAPRPDVTATRPSSSELSGTSRPVFRNLPDSRDSALNRPAASRIGSRDLRPEQTSGHTAISPMRFGTSGARDTASRGGSSTLPSALSLRSSRIDADTDRFGRAAVPRAVSASRLRGDPVHAAVPPSQSPAHPFGHDSAVYRPPYGAMGQHHQPYHPTPRPSHCPPPSHHYNDHPHYDHHNPYRHHPHACSPVWWGPVVYPAGFGLTWYSGDFALSIATYAPAYSYTRYYDSWHCGGWGYSSVYYGGWRSSWYGGFSYVYNPWPVYRTYYLYDPYPVQTVYVTQPAETVYVTQPASSTVYVNQPATTTVMSEQPAPEANTAYAAAPAAASPSAWEAAPAVEQSETAATTCFCPCRCNGQRPCTCSYPCGAEYALGDEEFDLSRGFASYSDTMSPEVIWSSYAGLDRWDTDSEAYDRGAIATLGNGSL